MNYLAMLKQALTENSGKVPPNSTAKTAKSLDGDTAATQGQASDTATVTENSEKHAIDGTAKTVKSTFWQLRQYPFKPVSGNLAVSTEPAPEPQDRLCYQCQYFSRSPYGYPLGLCRQHGNRIQHSTSQPTHFGCGDFGLRPSADATRTCLQCRHYSKLSTMCSEVNTGCPYPEIPPCSGVEFQPRQAQP